MKDTLFWAKDIQGTLQVVKTNPEGVLLSALDVSDITIDTDIDSINGTTVATDSGVTGAGVLRVTQATDVPITPYQIRGSVSTGYAVLTLSQEITVIPAVVGSHLDIASITGSNTSTVAVPVLIRNVLAGNVVERIVIPVGGTITKDYTVPIPQSDTGNVISAQVDVADQSDSPVVVSIRAIQK